MKTFGKVIDPYLMRYVPVRKRCAITAIYKDEDGYWAYVGNGYHCVGYFAEHVIHEDTIALFRSIAYSDLSQLYLLLGRGLSDEINMERVGN